MPSRTLRTAVLALLVSFGFVESALAYYNPRTGRFLNRDPVGEPGAVLLRQAAGRPFVARDPIDDESHLYRFVHNGPTWRIDPLGLTDDGVWTKCKKDCASAHSVNPDDWKEQQEQYGKNPKYKECVDNCVKKYPDPEGNCGDANSVTCWVDYSGLRIECHLGDDWVTCPIVCPSEKDYKKYGGPTPPGTYKIDNRRIHPEHQCAWYNLCPYSGKDCKFRTYAEGHKDYKRTHMGLHPGSVSLGCVTVTKDCWDKLDALVQRGKFKQGGHGQVVVTNATPQ